MRSNVGTAYHTNVMSAFQMGMTFAISWNVKCVRPSYTRSVLRTLLAAYTRRRHRASEFINTFHPDSLILRLSFFARSNIYSDDNSFSEKVMLLTDVCFGHQISMVRDTVLPQGVNCDTVSGYRLRFYPGCILLLFFLNFFARSKFARGCQTDKFHPRMMWLCASKMPSDHLTLFFMSEYEHFKRALWYPLDTCGTVIATTLIAATESNLGQTFGSLFYHGDLFLQKIQCLPTTITTYKYPMHFSILLAFQCDKAFKVVCPQ